MSQRVRICNRAGLTLATLNVLTERSWVLNGAGKAVITISVNDAKATKKILQYGNLVLIQHEKLPAWGGVIDPDRTWNKDGTIQLEVWSGEHLLRFRRSELNKTLSENSAGTLFEKLIDYGNAAEDMNIQKGAIWKGGTPRDETQDGKQLYEHVAAISKRTGYDWDVQPNVDGNGRLFFTANWYEQAGVAVTFELKDGAGGNIEATANPLREQGWIVNDLLGIGDGSTDETTITYSEIDTQSRAEYGLRQDTRDYNGNKVLETLQGNVRGGLAKDKNPIRIFNVIAQNVGNTFSYLRSGNILPLRMSSCGFLADGTIGVNTRVRIIGMKHFEARDVCELVCSEVT